MLTDTHVATVGITDKTAFIIGNGPSLREVHLASLSGHTTIGMNAAYRYWDEIDWYPTHYACLDLVVGLSHQTEIARLIAEGRIKTFLLRDNLIEALGAVAHDAKVINFDALKSRDDILLPPMITTGSHAALWAASLGYDQLVMLGIDGQYKEVVAGAQARDGIELEIVEEKENPNYFFQGYQKSGDRYNLPNPRPGLHVEAWHAAGAMLQDRNISTFNANAASAVQIFPFIALNDFLNGHAIPVRATQPITPPENWRGKTTSSRSADAHILSGSEKFRQFIRARITLLAAFGALLASGFVGTGYLGNWQPGQLLIFAMFALVSFALTTVVLYSRFATALHMTELKIQIEGLQARLADMERRQGHRPRDPSIRPI